MPFRRDLWEKALEEGPRLRKLSLLLLDYINLLSAELDETALIAHDRGWRSSRVAEGERLRAEIESYNRCTCPETKLHGGEHARCPWCMANAPK